MNAVVNLGAGLVMIAGAGLISNASQGMGGAAAPRAVEQVVTLLALIHAGFGGADFAAGIVLFTRKAPIFVIVLGGLHVLVAFLDMVFAIVALGSTMPSLMPLILTDVLVIGLGVLMIIAGASYVNANAGRKQYGRRRRAY